MKLPSLASVISAGNIVLLAVVSVVIFIWVSETYFSATSELPSVTAIPVHISTVLTLVTLFLIWRQLSAANKQNNIQSVIHLFDMGKSFLELEDVVIKRIGPTEYRGDKASLQILKGMRENLEKYAKTLFDDGIITEDQYKMFEGQFELMRNSKVMRLTNDIERQIAERKKKAAELMSPPTENEVK